MEKYGGDELVEKFYAIREERERYLREQWNEYENNSGPVVFRDIDFDHVIILLKINIPEKPYYDLDDSVFNAFADIVHLCHASGQLEKARYVIDTLQQLSLTDIEKARLLFLRGKLALLLYDWELSINYYKKAEMIYRELGDVSGRAAAYNNMGIISYEQWQTHTGKEYFEIIRSLFPDFDDDSLKIGTLMNIGIVHAIRGDAELALKEFDAVLEMIESKESIRYIDVLQNKAQAARQGGYYELAKKTIDEATRVLHYHSDPRLITVYTAAKAEIELCLGNYEECTRDLISLFKQRSKLHDATGIAEAYRLFGMLHMATDHLDLADSEIQISIRINKDKGHIYNLAESYYVYAQLAAKRGERSNQIEYLEKTLSLYRMIQADTKIKTLESEIKKLKD